jgi:hypothetical protein
VVELQAQQVVIARDDRLGVRGDRTDQHHSIIGFGRGLRGQRCGRDHNSQFGILIEQSGAVSPRSASGRASLGCWSTSRSSSKNSVLVKRRTVPTIVASINLTWRADPDLTTLPDN